MVSTVGIGPTLVRGSYAQVRTLEEEGKQRNTKDLNAVQVESAGMGKGDRAVGVRRGPTHYVVS